MSTAYGENAYRKLTFENGVHRVQWVPTEEQRGRVFTAKLVVGRVTARRESTGFQDG